MSRHYTWPERAAYLVKFAAAAGAGGILIAATLVTIIWRVGI